MSVQVHGWCAPHFEPVREAFAALLTQGQQRGGAVCIQIAGESVVDIWGGVAGQSSEQLWQKDTLVNLFSCTKTFTAVAALQLVAEGALDLDAPAAELWPEFAQQGKSCITLRQLLCHRAGLPAIRSPLPAEALYNWPQMTQALVREQPWWLPGTHQGYAPMTYGWLVGELIQRADGRAVGEAISARVAHPINLDFHLGLAEQDLPRVAFLSRGRNDFGDAAAQRLMKVAQTAPQSLTALSFNNPPGLMQSANKREWQCFVQPATNGHGNARTLANFYSALLDNKLLNHKQLTDMRREHSIGEDLTLLAHTRFGLGCWLDQSIENATFGLGSNSFGHPGAGGCLGFADPDREVGFGFVTNTLGPYVLMDPRAQMLVKVFARCLH